MVTIHTDGRVQFRVYLPHAESVELMSSVNDWAQSTPLQRKNEDGSSPCTTEDWNGWWHADVDGLDAGEHSFSYLVDNTYWLPDYAAHGVRRNSFGNWTSVLVIVRDAGDTARLPHIGVHAEAGGSKNAAFLEQAGRAEFTRRSASA